MTPVPLILKGFLPEQAAEKTDGQLAKTASFGNSSNRG